MLIARAGSEPDPRIEWIPVAADHPLAKKQHFFRTFGEQQIRVLLRHEHRVPNRSDEIVMNNMRRILEAAKENGVFVTIDMEDYTRCGKTIDIFKQLKSEYDNIGTVIQAYLYRTEKDIEDLNAYKPNLRLVKGAYKEPEEVAFPDKKDVDDNYKKIIKMHLLNGNYTAIASHDEAIIEYTKKLAEEHNIPRDQFEFQMLYGIRNERQLELVKEGYKMRVYVPYGNDWYGYFMRRLAERPANVAFVLKGMIKK